MIRTILAFLLFVFTNFALYGQVVPGSNEERSIMQMPDDTAKVNRLNDYALKIYSNPQKAISMLDLAASVAEKVDYPLGLSIAYSQRAGLFFYEMKLDSSKLLLDKAFNLVKNKEDKASRNQMASLINQYASIYQRNQNYDSAVERYLQAAAILKETGDETKIVNSYYNLSGIFKYLGDTAKTFFYAREANRLAKKTGDSALLIRAHIVLANAYEFVKNYDSVLLIAKKGLAIAVKQDVTFATGIFNNLTGLYYANNTSQFDSAIYHYNSALQSFNKINVQYDIALVLQNLGNVYLKKKDYSNAILFAEKAKRTSEELKFDQVLYLSLKDLVQAEEASGNIDASFRYLKQYVDVSDSIQSRNSKKRVYDLEAKYVAQQKEMMFQSQQKIIKSKNQLNYLLIGGLFLLLVVILLLFLNYQNKQKLQQQRIAELETQQRLTATEAVLKGEEQERTRLAKDLHDGLGGMLSGIKYSMKNMQSNLIMTPDNEKAFVRSIDMLDSSIQEMRRVAHNMMPEALVKFGLDTALRDFCNDIIQTGVLQVSYQSIGLEDIEIKQITAITIYRIVQELMHNSIKHAAAKSAVVQVAKSGKQVSVTVEDDGKGFDRQLLKHAKGIGWLNIQNRVEFLKGVLDIQSDIGRGTSVHFEFSI